MASDPLGRTCDCCFEAQGPGTLCPGKAHFLCSECLSNMLAAFCSAEYAMQKMGMGRVQCPMKDSEQVFSDGVLAALVPQDVFDGYLQVRIKVAEQGIQEQIEKEMLSKMEELKASLAAALGSADQMRLDKYRLEIIDDIFTLKCPRCKLAFLDYTGCSALSCSGCGCGFCSYCLEDCGKDAHQHFYANGSKCPKEGGLITVPVPQWQEYQRKRRARLLASYLQQVPPDWQQRVADAIAPEAKDLGVALPVLRLRALRGLALSVPRKLRDRLRSHAQAIEQEGVELRLPHANAPVAVRSAAGEATVHVCQAPIPEHAPNNVTRLLPNGFEVSIDDEWLVFDWPQRGFHRTWIKARHCLGRPTKGAQVTVRDANGYGSVMVRKSADQAEGANCAGFLQDGTQLIIIESWIELTWQGGRGFVRGCDVPDDDVQVYGPPEACLKAAERVKDIIELEVFPQELDATD